MPSDNNSLIEVLTDMLRSALAWEESGETSLTETGSLTPKESNEHELNVGYEDTLEETLKIPDQGGGDDQETDDSESADRPSHNI